MGAVREQGSDTNLAVELLDETSWYAEWLVTLSELPELLGGKVVRSELTYLLMRLDRSTPSTVSPSAGRTTTLASWWAHFTPS
jgi:hypothetical protein